MKKFICHANQDVLPLLTANSLSSMVQRMCLGFILICSIFIRFWIINAPALDRTYWKEIDYITISRNYWNHGYHFLRPEIDWPAEPPRVTAMEFPLVPFLTSLLYPIFGFNVVTVRIVSLFAYVLIIIYVFRLGKRELGPCVGLLGAFSASIMPLYHTFGRILFSEPLMIAMEVMALFHFAQWIDFQRKGDWFWAMAGFSLAVSLKLTPLYLLLPLVWIAFRTYQFNLKSYTSVGLLIVYALILPLFWYSYAYYLTYTSIDVFGIFQGHDKMQTFTMLSKTSWYTTMFQRILWDILGGKIGGSLCLIGMITALYIRRGSVFFFYLAAILCFFGIVAEGQLDAPYRQLTIFPICAIFIGIGALTIVTTIKAIISNLFNFRHSLSPVIPISQLILSLAIISTVLFDNYSAIFERDPFQPASPGRWKLAQQIKKYVEPGAKLVSVGEYTLHKGGNDLSPVLYYYANLQGWTLQQGEWGLERISALRERGATLFAAIQMSREPESMLFLKQMKAHYTVLYENQDKELLLIRLQ